MTGEETGDEERGHEQRVAEAHEHIKSLVGRVRDRYAEERRQENEIYLQKVAASLEQLTVNMKEADMAWIFLGRLAESGMSPDEKITFVRQVTRWIGEMRRQFDGLEHYVTEKKDA